MTAADILTAHNQYLEAIKAHDDAVSHDLLTQWLGSWQSIKDEQDALFAKIAHAQQVGHFSPAWAYQQSRYQSLLVVVAREIGKLANTLEGTVPQSQQQAVIQAQALAASAAQAQLEAVPTVDVNWKALNTAATVGMIANTAQGSPLRTLIDSLPVQAVDGVRSALRDGITHGWNPVKTAKRIKEAAVVPLVRAQRIARTETMRAYTTASIESMRANTDVVDAWVWMASLSERTCFPAGTHVTTDAGSTPIESVRAGDRVLAHDGTFRRVSECLSRDYSGEMVTIGAGAFNVTATADHPFLVEREGYRHWIEAADLRLGDTLFCKADSIAHEGNHSGLNVAVEGGGRQSQYSVPSRLNGKRLPGVLVDGLRGRVPILAVDLNNEFVNGQEKVNRPLPKGKRMLLADSRADSLKAQPSVLLGTRLPVKSLVALHRAKATLLALGWNKSKRHAAFKARHCNRGPSALLGAMLDIRALLCKDASAPNTWDVYGAGIAAFVRTVDAGHARKHCELVAASRTDSSRARRIGFARPGAVLLRSTADNYAEISSASDANAFNRWLRSASGSTMRVKPLKSGIAVTATEAASAFFDPCSRFIEDDPALLASAFHEVIISDLSTKNSMVMVYNLEVEGRHTFVAGGFVVHNCPICLAMNGTLHPLAEQFASHVSCRCVPVPKTKTWADILGPDDAAGIEETAVEGDPNQGWNYFQSLPDAKQRGMVGPGKVAYLYGRADEGDANPLRSLVGYHVVPKWGPERFERTLRDLRENPGYSPTGAIYPHGFAPGDSDVAATPSGGSPNSPSQGTHQPMVTIPVSAALCLVNVTYPDPRSVAAQAIDSVHSDGQLPQTIVVSENMGPSKLGVYRRSLNVIKVNSIGSWQALTTAHETGHLLDWQAIGIPGEAASESRYIMSDWRKAIKQSDAYKQINKILRTGKIDMPGEPRRHIIAKEREYVEYLASWRELWARSYSQFIAVKSGDADLLSDLQSARTTGQNEGCLRQWDDTDFEPIGAAIEAVFKAKGWMP